MNFRQTVSIYGGVATAVGLFAMMFGPKVLGSFGDFVQVDYGSFSLIRLGGVGFLLAGAVLLAVRTLEDRMLQRRIGFAMAAAHVFGGLVVSAQQIAIWDSPLGAALAVWLWLASLSFVVVVIQLRGKAVEPSLS